MNGNKSSTEAMASTTRVEERSALDEEWVRTDFDKAEVRMLA